VVTRGKGNEETEENEGTYIGRNGGNGVVTELFGVADRSNGVVTE